MIKKAARAVATLVPKGQSGSGSVLMLGACLVMVLLGVVVAQLGSVLVAKREVASAADLSALAAAGHMKRNPCAVARDIAEKNGVSVVSCQLDGLEATLEVRRELSGPLAMFGAPSARARAGPVRIP
ncbi:MAG: flp pilus-assembly TadE/G-like family protein [Corynebacteriales bacterium]|nr:flp pilus-assembly TadE/G-like family protein [Mycobacteriales bacterium]